MRALLGAQMLAPHLPSVRHRDRAVERRPAPPRRRRRVRALTLERLFDADHAGAVRPPPTRCELAADMAENRRGDILEHARTDATGNRKSVVYGQSVSVRVTLGVRPNTK